MKKLSENVTMQYITFKSTIIEEFYAANLMMKQRFLLCILKKKLSWGFSLVSTV